MFKIKQNLDFYAANVALSCTSFKI